jgi:hypothetical protein
MKKNILYLLMVIIIIGIIILLITSCEKEEVFQTGPDFLTSHEFSLYQYTEDGEVNPITPELPLHFSDGSGTINGTPFDWWFDEGLNCSGDFFVSLPTGYQGTNHIIIEYDFNETCKFSFANADNTIDFVYSAKVSD